MNRIEVLGRPKPAVMAWGLVYDATHGARWVRHAYGEEHWLDSHCIQYEGGLVAHVGEMREGWHRWWAQPAPNSPEQPAFGWSRTVDGARSEVDAALVRLGWVLA
ncbi:MAG: hypothetical protein VKL39_24820 [Leptolyngbyaceae bacterium]|nr:hypothetical protein [Leptolyngbyaceae bacterium]